MQSVRGWADEEFGDAKLGDRRLTRRLVRTASEVAARPAGKVTLACASSASREGAFRLLENPAVSPDDILSCVTNATLRRLPREGTVIVPIDSTSLHITDKKRSKGLGLVGARSMEARGAQVMTALAVTSEGQPIGIVAQKMWTRIERSTRRSRDRLKPGGESAYWVDVLEDCETGFSFTPGIEPWYQLDRGADCWQVLQHAIETGMLITIRAAHDRNLDDELDRLSEALEAAPVLAKTTIEVRASAPTKKHKRVGKRRRINKYLPARRARRARLSIRACSVPIVLGRNDEVVELNAIYVCEQSRSKDAIRWVLLTTHPIDSKKNVLKVVDAYALRWRVEDFHRAWKNGLCRVEDTQLRSRAAIFKWATLLATVATRAMRLTQQARTTPDAPATTEFSSIELEALVALRNPKMPADGNITLAVAVRWVAELGGYTGPWNGPAGATVIGRGLSDLLVVSRAFENRAEASSRPRKK